MELTGSILSPKLRTYPKYARVLEAGASKTSCFSSPILECGGTTLLQLNPTPPPTPLPPEKKVFNSLGMAPVPVLS